MFYNIVGSIAWVCSMMLGGYFLDSWVEKKFDFSLKDHIEVIAIGIILVTTLPVLYKLFLQKNQLFRLRRYRYKVIILCSLQNLILYSILPLLLQHLGILLIFMICFVYYCKRTQSAGSWG